MALSLAGCIHLLGCGEEDEPVGEQARISGTVRDQESNERLSGVKVVFTSDTLDSAEDRTNQEGEFSMLVTSRVLQGRLRASKQGYETRQVSVYLDEPDVRIEVSLPPAE